MCPGLFVARSGNDGLYVGSPDPKSNDAPRHSSNRQPQRRTFTAALTKPDRTMRRLTRSRDGENSDEDGMTVYMRDGSSVIPPLSTGVDLMMEGLSSAVIHEA